MKRKDKRLPWQIRIRKKRNLLVMIPRKQQKSQENKMKLISIQLEWPDLLTKKTLLNSKIQRLTKVTIKLLHHLLQWARRSKPTKRWDQSMFKNHWSTLGLKTKMEQSSWTANRFNNKNLIWEIKSCNSNNNKNKVWSGFMEDKCNMITISQVIHNKSTMLVELKVIAELQISPTLFTTLTWHQLS